MGGKRVKKTPAAPSLDAKGDVGEVATNESAVVVDDLAEKESGDESAVVVEPVSKKPKKKHKGDGVSYRLTNNSPSRVTVCGITVQSMESMEFEIVTDARHKKIASTVSQLNELSERNGYGERLSFVAI